MIILNEWVIKCFLFLIFELKCSKSETLSDLKDSFMWIKKTITNNLTEVDANEIKKTMLLCANGLHCKWEASYHKVNDTKVYSKCNSVLNKGKIIQSLVDIINSGKSVLINKIAFYF